MTSLEARDQLDAVRKISASAVSAASLSVGADNGPANTEDHSRIALWRLLCGSAAAAGILVALVVTPDLVAEQLSPDGELAGRTVGGVNLLRGLAAFLAAGLILLTLNGRWAHQTFRTVIDANSGIWPWAAVAAAAGLALVTAGALISSVTGTPVRLLLRDPNAIAVQPFYYGALEYAGVILLAATAGIGLFSSTLSSGALRRFLFIGGLLGLLLTCDDLYSLHENSSRVGLSEWIVFGVYGLLVLGFAAAQPRQFLASPFILLIAAGAFFATAIALDRFTGLNRNFPHGSEDMLELVGICFWSSYFIKCSHDALRGARSRTRVSSARDRATE